MEETVERVTPGTESWESYGAEHMQRYEFFRDRYRGRKILDAACGTGYGTKYMLDQGAASATGIDVSDDAVSFAREHYKSPNLRYLKHDCMELDALSDQYDMVVSFETIEHLTDPSGFITQVAGRLSPGGVFVCSTPNKDRLSGAGYFNPFHPNELSFEEFRRAFESHFTITGIYHQSETVEYLRYLELKHMLHQQHARTNAFLFSRIELGLRKLIGKKFRPIPFFHQKLEDLQHSDLRIESLEQPRGWHKTYVLQGVVRKP